MRQSVARSWKALAKERLENQKPTIPLGTKFWPLSRTERDQIVQLFETPTSIIWRRRFAPATTTPRSKCSTLPTG